MVRRQYGIQYLEHNAIDTSVRESNKSTYLLYMSHLPKRASSTLDLGFYGLLGLLSRFIVPRQSIDPVPDVKEDRYRQFNYLAPGLNYDTNRQFKPYLHIWCYRYLEYNAHDTSVQQILKST